MTAPDRAPAARTSSRLMMRLLTATALSTGMAGFGTDALAQVVIGGEKQQSAVEIYNVTPSPFGQDGWPYNVKRSKKSWVSADSLKQDPSTLPSRQVSPQLIQAARLEQSGLSKTEAKDTAKSLTAGMKPPQIVADQPNEARDPSVTPAVTPNQLLAAETPAAEQPADAQVADAAPVADTTKNLADSLTPLGEPAAPVAVADAAPPKTTEPAAPKAGRALFGRKGKPATEERIQVADATPPTASSNADQVLRVPDAPVDTTGAEAPAPAAPAPGAMVEPTGQVASLADMQAPPPKLLGRISEDNQGQPRQQVATVKPLAAPTTPVLQAPEPAPVPEPVAAAEPESAPAPVPEEPARHHDAVAVLPSKAEEKEVAAMPQPQDSSNDIPPNEPEAPEPAPVATPKPAERGFWDRLFGEDEAPKPAATESAPVAAAAVPDGYQPSPSAVDAPKTEVAAPAPVYEPAPAPKAEPAPKPMPVAKAEIPAGYQPSPSALDKPQPAPAAEAPSAAPEPLSEPLPGPRVVAPEIIPAPMEPDPMPAPQPMPVQQVEEVQATPAPQTVETPVVVRTAPTDKQERGFWDRLFGSDETTAAPQPVPATMLPSGYEPSATPVYDDRGAAAPMAALPEPLIEPVAPIEDLAVPAVATRVAPVAITPMPEAPPAPAVPVMTQVPTFRVEAPPPAAPNKLSTPRLVPIAPTVSAMAAPAPARTAARPVAAAEPGAPMAQINFLPASQAVDAVGQSQLKAVADALQMDPGAMLMLNAYANGSNATESRRISLNRALAVRSKLAELGIQPSRIEVNARGDDTPSGIDGSDDRVDAILH